jgi:hypothetical protein
MFFVSACPIDARRVLGIHARTRHFGRIRRNGDPARHHQPGKLILCPFHAPSHKSWYADGFPSTSMKAKSPANASGSLAFLDFIPARAGALGSSACGDFVRDPRTQDHTACRFLRRPYSDPSSSPAHSVLGGAIVGHGAGAFCGCAPE